MTTPRLHRPLVLLFALLLVLSGGAAAAGEPSAEQPSQRAGQPQPRAEDRMLLMGQSARSSWDDFTSFGQDPGGGSVYYEVSSGDWVSPGHQEYAELLAEKRATIQVGISWKDNPPGFPGGDEAAKAARSRAVTQEIADGGHTAALDVLVDFINSHPDARFLLRADYEVSSYYHCTTDDCTSYRGAFRTLRDTISARTDGGAEFVFHPVRGEYEKLYPGDAAVDWIGSSVFAHELCLPLYDRGYQYNGTPPDNYDVEARQCRNAYIGESPEGHPEAVWQNWDFDGNVLKMMKFAKDHGKPMIVSEGGMMNFTEDAGDTSGLEPDLGPEWVERFFALMDYSGPIPNLPGEYDLSGVIRAATYINLDFRYGWDGEEDGSFEFEPDTGWFVNGKLSGQPAVRDAFCQGLTARSFTTRCT